MTSHRPVPGASMDDRGLLSDKRRAPIPGSARTVDDVVAAGARSHPEREALVGRNGRYSYAALDAEVSHVAAFLAGLGVRPGDRVAASLPNRPDIVVAFLATMRLGAVWVGVNRRLAVPEKEYIIEDSGASVLLAEPETWDAFEPKGPRGSADLEVVEVRDDAPACEWSRRDPEARRARPLTAIDPFAPAAIAYTSGTTGRPKGAVHSQHNLVLVGAANARFDLWRRDPRQAAVLALTILNAMALGPLLVFQLGGSCICVDRTDPVGLAGWIEAEQIQTFSCTPPILYDLLSHSDVQATQLRSLANVGVGGQPLPHELAVEYHSKTGGYACASYGLTEAPAVVAMQAPGQPTRLGSSGSPLPHLSVSILDDAGKKVTDGEVGEICVGPVVNGPWARVYGPFLGYWGRPDATREALAGGVLHTGDFGYVDDGQLFVTGRKSDLILRGGANVYPAEVERVLTGHPMVSAAVVLGKRDRRLGERVVAFVELGGPASGPRSGEESSMHVTADSLRELCAKELARYKVPDEIYFVDHFERNAMGKVLKVQLREQLEREP